MASSLRLAFVRKTNEPGARGFAVYLNDRNGRYLGDVTPVGPTGAKTDPHGRYPVWSAHPAGESVRLELLFPDRATAAEALLLYAS